MIDSYNNIYLSKDSSTLFAEYSGERLKSKVLKCCCYTNAYIVPNLDGIGEGVYTSEGCYVRDTSVDGRGGNIFKGEGIHSIESAIYLGCLCNTWGHCFTNHLGRLWFLETEMFRDLLEKGVPVYIITHRNQKLEKYVWDFLIRAFPDVLNIHIRILEHPVICGKLFLPDSSIFLADNRDPYGDRYYTIEYKKAVEKIRNSIVKSRCFPKVYFSRTKTVSYGYRELGEKSIEEVFRKKGYTIIHPEEYSVEDQLSILNNCTHFAATEGSISHSALFCRSRAEVAILRKANYVNTYQLIINDIAGYKYAYIDVNHTIPPYDFNSIVSGPFYLYVSKYLKKYLELQLNSPYWFHFSYLWYRIRRIQIVKSKIANRKIIKLIEKKI